MFPESLQQWGHVLQIYICKLIEATILLQTLITLQVLLEPAMSDKMKEN